MKKIAIIYKWIINYPLTPKEQNFIDNTLFDLKVGGMTILIMIVIAVLAYFAVESFNQPPF
jgi:hypothetical protein